MAKQSGILPLKGTIGNITFFKTKDGWLAKEKSAVPAEQIATDPNYARTRENMAEFSRAGKASKLLRKELLPIIQDGSDNRVVSRITKLMMDVIRKDTVNPRGQRNVVDGDISVFEGFEFNRNGKLDSSLLAPFTAALNRAEGKGTIDILPFVPVQLLTFPQGATHFRLRAGTALVDFENATGEAVTAETAYLPINILPTAAISLQMQVTAASEHPMFLVLGIDFVQEVNGVMYALQNGTSNACTLVKVDGGN
jgi:hypothetical protein